MKRMILSLAAMAMLMAPGTIKAQNFDDYFTDKTLRIDYTFAGNQKQQMIAVDELNVMPRWYGKRQRLAELPVEGNGQMRKGQQNIDLKAIVRDFSPHNTNLSEQWGNARFSADIETTLKGSKLNDAEGFLHLTNFSMKGLEKDYKLSDLQIHTGFDDKTHFLQLSSDFADAEIRGDFDYQTLTQSFTNFLASQMPTLPGLPKVNPNTHNNFTVNATIKKSDWLTQFFDIPLTIRQPIFGHRCQYYEADGQRQPFRPES